MGLLRTFSRLAFICNICFLLAVLLRYIPHPPEGELVSTIIVLGYFLAILVNIVVNLWLLVLLLFRGTRRRRAAAEQQSPLEGGLRRRLPPRWLMIVNLLFFLVQLFILSIPASQ